MDIQYRRDMNHTYMVLESADAGSLEGYETRIILTNRIGGLLPCSLQYLDNKTCYCYDTTSRQSLATELEGREINRREMQKLLGNILSVMSQLEEYLLSLRHLVLTPEQIFLVPATMEVWLCFAPFYDKDAKEGLLGVTEFLLSHTGKDSQDAVILGSRFSHALRQPAIQLSDLERILYGDLPGDEGYAGNAGLPPAPGNRAAEEGLYPNAAGLQNALDGRQAGLDYPGPGAGPARPAAGRQESVLTGRTEGNSARDSNGEKTHKGGLRRKINWYVVSLVLAGAVLAAGVYVFLHYYNGKLPPWPFLAGAAAAVAAAVILVIIIRRKALKKPWAEAAAEGEASFSFPAGKGQSPYQGAYGTAMDLKSENTMYGKATGPNGAGPVFGSEMGLNGFSQAFGNERGMNGASPVFGNGAGVNGSNLAFGSRDVTGFSGAEPGLTTILAPLKTDVSEAYLVPENGPEAGKELRLTARRTRIGKPAGHADICTDSPAVSRLHAEIVRRGEAFYIRDMNSRNGTRVNGEILSGNTEKLLHDGDRLTLADRVFIFRMEGQEHEERLASILGKSQPVTEQKERLGPKN